MALEIFKSDKKQKSVHLQMLTELQQARNKIVKVQFLIKIFWSFDMTGINSHKCQNDFSIPGRALRRSDLHPVSKEILKTELSVFIVCLPIHLQRIVKKSEIQSSIKHYSDDPLKFSSYMCRIPSFQYNLNSRETSILGDVVHPFVVPLFYQLYRNLDISIPNLDIIG